jgi:hypothetical protein
MSKKWFIEMHNEECGPMFIFFIALGFFLPLAARTPRNIAL